MLQEMFWGEEASTSQGMENVLSIEVPVNEKSKSKSSWFKTWKAVRKFGS